MINVCDLRCRKFGKGARTAYFPVPSIDIIFDGLRNIDCSPHLVLNTLRFFGSISRSFVASSCLVLLAKPTYEKIIMTWTTLLQFTLRPLYYIHTYLLVTSSPPLCIYHVQPVQYHMLRACTLFSSQRLPIPYLSNPMNMDRGAEF